MMESSQNLLFLGKTMANVVPLDGEKKKSKNGLRPDHEGCRDDTAL